MVNIQSPLIDAEYDEQTGAYIGVLERQLLGQNVLINKYRALLEVVTGEKHEEMVADLETGQLKEIAVRAIMRKEGVTIGQARRKLREREAAAEERPQPTAG